MKEPKFLKEVHVRNKTVHRSGGKGRRKRTKIVVEAYPVWVRNPAAHPSMHKE